MRNFGSPGFSSALEVPRVNAQWLTFSSLPIAATGGPDLADIRFSAERRELDALLATKHLDIRTDGSTVRLSFAGLTEAKADFDQCMANIGSPAKGWSSAEVDQLIGQIKRGKAKCSENKRTRVTTCDVD